MALYLTYRYVKYDGDNKNVFFDSMIISGIRKPRTVSHLKDLESYVEKKLDGAFIKILYMHELEDGKNDFLPDDF